MSDDLLKEALPEPWTFGVTKDGRVFFINDEEKTTTWIHPDTGQPAQTGFHRRIDLPCGWEEAFSREGDVYYINHNAKTTTFEHPCSPTRTDEVNDSTLKKKKRRHSFTGTLTKPLFRRNSSKVKATPEKTQPKEKRPSSARKHSTTPGHKGIKMTVMRRDPDASVTRSGWLYKQDSSGMGGVKIWRKRWFVLSDFCLFYYKDNKDDEALGSIVLPSYVVSTVNPDDRINRKYAFKVEHPGMRTCYISAESYNSMAEWIRDLSPVCSLANDQNKSGSRKSSEAKECVSKKPTDEDAEFGFNESRMSTKSIDEKSDSSSIPVNKEDSRLVANGNNNNIRKSISSASTLSSQARRESSNSRLPRSSSASNRTYNSITSSSGTHPYGQSSTPRNKQNEYPTKYITSHHNGECFSDVSTPDSKRLAPPNDKVHRNNSMVKLESWVQSQKVKQHSTNTSHPSRRSANTYDTASEMSAPTRNSRNLHQYPGSGRYPTQRIPSSGRRYKPGTYSDYMDPMEVASSIMSVPPMYRNKVTSLPRPRSSQELDGRRGNRQKMANSKSVGHLSPDREKPNTPSKSEHSLPHHFSRVEPNYYQNPVVSPESGDSARRNYDDVFSPQSNLFQDNRHFDYDPNLTNQNPPFATSIPPLSNQPSYEIKQVDVKGKQGQLRAFAISARPQPSMVNAKTLHNDTEKVNLSEEDIEKKLKRLNELDAALRTLSSEMQMLQKDKQRLEISLHKAKSSYTTTLGSEFELEEKLSKVKSQLAKSTQKLKAIARENEAFEREIRKLKAKLLEQLNKKIESKSNQRQLEWELGKVQLIMEEVNKNKVGLVNKIQSFDDDTRASDSSPTSSERDRRSVDIVRSPRDVKRISTERRSVGGTLNTRGRSSASGMSQNSNYFTLPGHGVSRATSVDSLTAGQIARFTRPLSARSTNLHRTKSAAERLLFGSQGNLQDPDEIKKIQREININRRRTLTGDFSRRHGTAAHTYPHHDAHMKVGVDVQMAIKHHRMPKVLQRAKRDMQRNEADRHLVMRDYDYDADVMDDVTSPIGYPSVNEIDVEPEDPQVDLNLTHQLDTPDKVDIPDRLLEYEDIELSPEQERLKQKKINAIENMLARSGQPASRPSVHLAAALAAEAGTVARAVAYQAHQSKDLHPSIV